MSKNKKVPVYVTLPMTDDTKQAKITKIPLPSPEDVEAAKKWVDENEK